MRPNCVVFDMDGVLFDSESLVLSCWERVADAHAIARIRQTCQRCLGINAVTTKQIFRQEYGADFPYDTYKAEMSALYWEAVEHGALALKPGVREILQALRTGGYRVGIASSTRREAVLKTLGLFDLTAYFDQIVGGDQVHRSKPDPEIYQKACAALCVPPESAYAVEDSYHGVQSAHDAGLHVIMIPDLLPPTPEMEHLTTRIFPDLHAFRAFLFDT